MPNDREALIRQRLRDDFHYYAPRCLAILPKKDATGRAVLEKFAFNAAQEFVHQRLEEQRRSMGWVRAIILKGRQQGISTYTEARFYHKTSQNPGEKTFILTHQQQATENLFAMVARYHENCPPMVRPSLGVNNAKGLKFDRLDSSYQVATAGAKGAGRSATLTNVHGSEVAYWENGEDHLSGMLQAVPLAPGTEVVLESTARGVGDVFHKQWVLAETGQSDFQAIFVPWFWQPEYTRDVPAGFELEADEESVPSGELTEEEYRETFRLSLGQMFWRRRKIIEMGGGEEGFFKFKQEYPASADEAFQSTSSHSFLSRRAVLAARRSQVATEGRLLIGVDPGGDQEENDPSCIIRRRTRRLFNPQLLKMNTMQLAGTLHRIIRQERPHRMFIDVGGIGRGVFDRLAELEGTRGIIVPVNFGEAASDPESYVNRKAEMAWNLREWLDQPGGANIPDEDAVQADLLSSVMDDPDSNQRKRLKTKKWMRSKGLRSPNIFDAACLTFAEPVAVDLQSSRSAVVDFDPFTGDLPVDRGWGNSAVDFDPF